MARLFVVPIDLSNLEILNVRAQILSGSDPTGIEGKFYYNSTTKTFKFYNNTAWVNLGRLDQISAPTASVDLNSQKIINLLNPTDPQDAATKDYVDNLQANTSVKNPVRVATVGTNITLAGGAPNTLDGITLAANDRILVKDQSTGSQNGLYFVQTLGTGANGTWVRTLDADVSADVVSGLQVYVSEGTVNADSVWQLTTNAPITLDTTALTFTRPGATGGNTALGTNSLKFATGTGNTAVGTSAGDDISSGTNNTVVGDTAGGSQTTSSGLTAVGKSAAAANTAADTTAVGLNALIANTSGTGNTAVGARALDAVSTTTNNTAVGTDAGGAHTGSNATFVGFNAGLLTTGNQNTAVGSTALDANTSGTDSTAVGYDALGLSTGNQNTAIGSTAGNTNTTGTGNTFLGYNADTNSASGTNRTAVGANASVTADNTVQLGDASVTNVNTAGTYTGTRFISTVPTGTAPLTVASTTLVTNLNADLLDGLNTATTGTANTVVIRDANGRTQMVDPVAAQDVATKNYVDSVATGLDVKASVRAATTTAGTLATSFENLDIIDGVTLATGDRILIKDQTIASENGIYVVNASGAPTRATDADTSAEVTAGMFTFVAEGTVNADTGWILSTNDPITLGSTNLTFVQFSSAGTIEAGAGLTKTGSTIDIIAADGSITVNADNITVGLVPITKGGTNATTAAAARTNLVVPSFFAASHGDGAATTYNIDHNLGTLDVLVNVYRNSDGVEIMPDITRSTTNRVIVGYAVAPTANQFRAVIHGGV